MRQEVEDFTSKLSPESSTNIINNILEENVL